MEGGEKGRSGGNEAARGAGGEGETCSSWLVPPLAGGSGTGRRERADSEAHGATPAAAPSASPPPGHGGAARRSKRWRRMAAKTAGRGRQTTLPPPRPMLPLRHRRRRVVIVGGLGLDAPTPTESRPSRRRRPPHCGGGGDRIGVAALRILPARSARVTMRGAWRRVRSGGEVDAYHRSGPHPEGWGPRPRGWGITALGEMKFWW